MKTRLSRLTARYKGQTRSAINQG